MFPGLAIKTAMGQLVSPTSTSCAQNLLVRASTSLITTRAVSSDGQVIRGIRKKDTKEKPMNQMIQQKLDKELVKAQENMPATSFDIGKELQEMGPTNRGFFYPEQMEWLDERLVRISKPTKNVMQSGTSYTNCWKIEFNSQKRWENWLMGWTSSGDPVSNLSLTFPTKEDAIAFCERNELQWFVEEQPERKVRKKSYADNFSWNKRTRLGNK